jgi:hypothetical protein
MGIMEPVMLGAGFFVLVKAWFFDTDFVAPD